MRLKASERKNSAPAVPKNVKPANPNECRPNSMAICIALLAPESE